MTANGVWQYTIGTPERVTPLGLLKLKPARQAINHLPPVDGNPLQGRPFSISTTLRGTTLSYPLQKDEQIFGFGLQLKSFNQTGKKKTLRVNSDPVSDTGDSHAPVPFYVSTAGYGLLVDTARYASFYCGSHHAVTSGKPAATASRVAESTAELYKGGIATDALMQIDIPAAQGVRVYVFGGPTLREALMRYNLFCGGGALPPMWGLGNWYRAKGDSNEAQILALVDYFRNAGIPLDVLGLEPGWQTHAYSCTFAWSPERFPDPDRLIRKTARQGIRLNLWEHAFTHPDSPLYGPLKPYAGDLAVWGGLVPDFSRPQARQRFADYHRQTLVDHGIAGFKLDECDNSDFIGSPWSFPECSRFKSGIDGEQMHSLFGMLYQKTMLSIYDDKHLRTYSEVRSSHIGAAPMPFVLYSDLYNHADFIRGIVTSAFGGLLWCPEVREASTTEDLIRRVQSVIFSPQSLINAWYLKMPPWLQIHTGKNKNDERMADASEVEAQIKVLMELRMRLVPYLYAAFFVYRQTGLPPFRALCVDYPGDRETYTVDSQYMMGDGLMVAPVTAPNRSRKIYFPAGQWYCFWTNTRYEGGQTLEIEVPLERIPVFVKENAIIPLAEPVQAITRKTVFELTVRTYGPDCRDFTLLEDDGETTDYRQGAYNIVTLSYSGSTGPSIKRTGTRKKRYKVIRWDACAER